MAISNEDKLRLAEIFRVYDDLDPVVRKAIREAYYMWPAGEAMTLQHQHFNLGLPIQAVADIIKERDEQLYEDRMRPKLYSHESSSSNS
jgi:hypothetical protein